MAKRGGSAENEDEEVDDSFCRTPPARVQKSYGARPQAESTHNNHNGSNKNPRREAEDEEEEAKNVRIDADADRGDLTRARLQLEQLALAHARVARRRLGEEAVRVALRVELALAERRERIGQRRRLLAAAAVVARGRVRVVRVVVGA